jgi:hypothetical protein
MKTIELTKWDWLAKKEGLASERIAKAPPGKPMRGLAENALPPIETSGHKNVSQRKT